jgi:hypothetical protein
VSLSEYPSEFNSLLVFQEFDKSLLYVEKISSVKVILVSFWLILKARIKDNKAIAGAVIRDKDTNLVVE